MITKYSKPARLPQAPRTALPELAEFLARLRVHLTQGPSAETLRQVRADFSLLTLGRKPPSPVQRAAALLATQLLQEWQTIAWSEGAKDWWRAKFPSLSHKPASSTWANLLPPAVMRLWGSVKAEMKLTDSSTGQLLAPAIDQRGAVWL